jgi:hypothetical protein
VVDTRAASKAEAAFKKQQQVREGEKAMAEYRAALAAEERKTARLRALRLAKESAGAAPAAVTKPKARPKPRGGKLRRPASH